MARKLTQQQLETIRRNPKLPVRTLAHRAGCSVGAVHNVLSAPRTSLAKRRKPADAAPAAPSAAGAPTAAEGTPVERLERAVAALERAAQQAAADGDQARVVAALRAVSDVTKTIAVLTPPAAVNPNDRPDFVKAADECRKAWLDHLERVIADEATP